MAHAIPQYSQNHSLGNTELSQPEAA
jgi:hypothetical protein